MLEDEDDVDARCWAPIAAVVKVCFDGKSVDIRRLVMERVFFEMYSVWGRGNWCWGGQVVILNVK